MEYKKIGEISKLNPESIGKIYNYTNIKYLDTANITCGKIDTIVDFKTNDAPSRAKRIVRKNDIIYSTVRPNLRHYGLLRKVEENLIVSTGFVVIRCDENKVLPEYLYAYLTLPQITSKMHSIAETATSTYPSIKPSDIKNIEIPLPSKDKQLKISKILSSIDKKIELNNHTNDNLFKFVINYLNDKKEKTEVTISNFAKIQGGYAFKSKDLLDNQTNNRIIKIKNLRSEINVDVVNSQFVEDSIANNIDRKFKLNKGDVVIAMTGAELGKTGFIYGFDNYYLNQRVGAIRGKNKESELYIKINFLSDSFQTLLNSKGYGSAQPNISTKDIENMLINDITEENLKKLYEQLNPIYYKIISNYEENLNLEQLRDTLLPKLMNGEIDLEKIKI